jgi:hypothetical protein
VGLVIDVDRTAAFHLACVTRDEAALKAVVDGLGEARIGFMDGAGEDAQFVDNTDFYQGKNGIVFTPADDNREEWNGWRGDLVWKEETPKPHKCAICKERNCPVRQVAPLVPF